MSWKKEDNPYEEPRPDKDKVYPPATHVEFKCAGCLARGNSNKTINVRLGVDDYLGDNEVLHTKKHCRDCHWQYEVTVYKSGAVQVTMSNEFGAYPRALNFRKVWQDKVKKK